MLRLRTTHVVTEIHGDGLRCVARDILLYSTLGTEV